MTEEEFRKETLKLEQKKTVLTAVSIFVPLLIGSIAYASSVYTEHMRAKDRAWEISDKFETTMIDLLVKHNNKPCELNKAVNIVYEKESWPWLVRLRENLESNCNKSS